MLDWRHAKNENTFLYADEKKSESFEVKRLRENRKIVWSRDGVIKKIASDWIVDRNDGC